MFRRKGGEPTDTDRDEDTSGSRDKGTRLKNLGERIPRTAGTKVSFHPDVPHRAPASLSEPTQSDIDTGRMTVGREMTLSGCKITECERLTIEGTVEASMVDGRILEIAKGGCFKGTASVDNAEISGTFDGELTVRKRLSVQSSGNVSGTIRYGQLEVERGGRVNGTAEYDPSDREADLQSVSLDEEESDEVA